MRAITISKKEEEQIEKLRKELGIASKSALIRAALRTLEKISQEEKLRREIQESVTRCGAADREENRELFNVRYDACGLLYQSAAPMGTNKSDSVSRKANGACIYYGPSHRAHSRNRLSAKSHDGRSRKSHPHYLEPLIISSPLPRKFIASLDPLLPAHLAESSGRSAWRFSS